MEETHRHEEWKPAIEEYATTLAELLSTEEQDRRLEAVDRGIYDEAEALREYLKARENRRLAEQRRIAITEWMKEVLGRDEAMVGRMEREIETEHKQSRAAWKAMEGLEDEALARLERIRFLQSLRERLI